MVRQQVTHWMSFMNICNIAMKDWQLHVNVFRTFHIIAIWGKSWVWNPFTMIAHRLQQHYHKPCWLSGYCVIRHTMSLEPLWWAWWPTHHDLSHQMLSLWWDGFPFGSLCILRTDHLHVMSTIITCKWVAWRIHPTIFNAPPLGLPVCTCCCFTKLCIMQVVLLKSKSLTRGHVLGNCWFSMGQEFGVAHLFSIVLKAEQIQ